MSKTRIETGQSRRAFLKTGTGLAAGAALPAAASAQGGQGADPELARLQSQRRILLKGGVVLTMDPPSRPFRQRRRANRGRQDS